MLQILQIMKLSVRPVTREVGGDSLLLSGSHVCVNSSAREGNLSEHVDALEIFVLQL